jgi:glycosyltransferase involved in cell wall biosynthesis
MTSEAGSYSAVMDGPGTFPASAGTMERSSARPDRIRVMNTITGLNVGGAEILLLRYLGRLPSDQYTPGIISLMSGCPLESRAADSGFDVRSLGMAESRFSISPLAKLRRQVAEFQPDLFHGWMYHGNIAATVASLLYRRRPVIWSIHHSLSDISAEKPMTQALIRLLAVLSPKVSAISYCSAVSADQHEAVGFDPSKRVIIPNGTDCTVFKPDAQAGNRLRRMLGIPNTRVIIGNVGRAHPMKDHAGLVRSLGILVAKGYDVHGLIIGKGHESSVASQVAKELGITDRITFLGVRDDISEITPGLDIFALSSGWGEAFSLAISEAMACGVPSVTTDVGDCGMLINDPQLIVPPKKPEALAAALERLVKMNPEERQALGMSARTRVLENFSLANYTSRHVELYSKALEKRHMRKGRARRDADR